MAESMTRRAAIAAAWAEYASRNGPSDAIAPAATHEVGFKSGFNTAWAVLIAEIGPLVADLCTLAEFDRGDIRASMEDEIRAHLKAVNRLRELVRDLEGEE